MGQVGTVGSGPGSGLRYQVNGGVATLTFDRPDRLNALSAASSAALLQAVDAAATDPSVRAVVLTGSGGAFCAGADLADLGTASDEEVDVSEGLRRWLNPTIARLVEMPKPALAAVSGAAAGAGMALALACDLRLAARSAVFLTAFTRVGLGPDAGMSWTLPRLVGSARAAALLMLSERVPAERALEIGLVQAVVPDEALADAAAELAAKLAARSTPALAAVKRLLNASATSSLEEALALEADTQRELGYGADHREAVRRFLGT